MLDRRRRSDARARVRLEIEDALDEGLPRVYSSELYQRNVVAVFEHVYESYPERDTGVYASAG